jgi:hypothetical protein
MEEVLCLSSKKSLAYEDPYPWNPTYPFGLYYDDGSLYCRVAILEGDRISIIGLC